MLLAISKLVFQLLLAVHQLLHCVVLTDGQSTALLHNLVQVTDLTLQILDKLASLFLFVFGSFDQLPSLVNLTFEDGDGVAIFLGQLYGGLDLGCVLHDGVLKFLAALYKAFFAFIGCLESTVQLFVFSAIAFH